ncbi:MAG: hypothetical protein V3T42_06750 [Nitrospirales bacterium]
MKKMPNAFLRVWLIFWVITLPLIHIHPEADHAHGMSGHVHGGTYHSILLSTPICAYQDHPHHHDSFSPGDTFGPSESPSHPPHGFEHATYSFSIIKPSIDLESEKSEFQNDGVVTYNVESLNVPYVSKPDVSVRKRLFSILPKTLSPRAPPVLTI